MGKPKTQRTDTVETLLVNAKPGTGDKQLKDYALHNTARQEAEAVLRTVLEAQKTNYSPSFEDICRSNEEYEGGLSSKVPKPPERRRLL